MELGKQGEVPRQETSCADRFDLQGFDPDKLIEHGGIEAAGKSAVDSFDPDRLISPENSFDGDDIESQDVDGKDGSDVRPPGELDEAELYSTSEARKAQASLSKGEWGGEPGNSEFTPESTTARELMRGYGRESVDYKDGVVDFAPFAKDCISIGHMTPDIVTNREQAYKALSERWNAESRDGRTDWCSRDVADWKTGNNLEFHECSDLRTCQFVPAAIHQACKHTGGRYEARCRDMMNNGGGFDE